MKTKLLIVAIILALPSCSTVSDKANQFGVKAFAGQRTAVGVEANFGGWSPGIAITLGRKRNYDMEDETLTSNSK